MHCFNCGFQFTKQIKYCVSCGVSLSNTQDLHSIPTKQPKKVSSKSQNVSDSEASEASENVPAVPKTKLSRNLKGRQTIHLDSDESVESTESVEKKYRKKVVIKRIVSAKQQAHLDKLKKLNLGSKKVKTKVPKEVPENVSEEPEPEPIQKPVKKPVQELNTKFPQVNYLDLF